MGLLDRARTLDDDQTQSGNDSPRQLVEAALAAVGSATGLVDFPREVFDAFRKVVGFNKGAFLLPDASAEEFYPWISVGFDRTTTRRLRIPFSAMAPETSGVILEKPPEAFAPMLSNREYGLMGTPMLIRLGEGEIPAALIITTDGPRGGTVDDDLAEALGILNERLGNEISESRSLAEDGGQSESTSLSEWLDGWEGNEGALAILDASNAIDALMESIAGLELYRARKDVIGLLRRITGRMGRFHDAKDGRVVIIFPPERLPDEGLWLHQLSLAFASAFKNLEKPPVFEAEIHAWPADRDAVESALAGLL